MAPVRGVKQALEATDTMGLPIRKSLRKGGILRQNRGFFQFERCSTRCVLAVLRESLVRRVLRQVAAV